MSMISNTMIELAASVEELPDGKITIRVKCEDCGHEQDVHGTRYDGHTYFGSGYDWCDRCDGLPHPIR